jgi:hypothetical protein
MKPVLFSLVAASTFGLVSLATGRHFDAADFIVTAFSAGLVAWTIAQYSRSPRPLYRHRAIRVTAPIVVRPTAKRAVRLAA